MWLNVLFGEKIRSDVSLTFRTWSCTGISASERLQGEIQAILTFETGGRGGGIWRKAVRIEWTREIDRANVSGTIGKGRALF